MTNTDQERPKELDYRTRSEEREFAWVPYLCIGVTCVFLGLHRLLRLGFETSNNAYLSALALCVILHLGPALLRRAFAGSRRLSLIPYSGWLGIVVFLLLAAGFLSDGRSFARYGTYTVAVLCIIAAPFLLRRIPVREVLVIMVVSVAFGFCAALDSWSGKNDVGHPLFDEELALGRNDNDIYFHAAMASMIQTHGIPSTGLHGVPYMAGHFGGQVMAAELCNLTGVHPIDFYVVILVPLFYSLYLNGIIRLGILIYGLCRLGGEGSHALQDRIESWLPQLAILLLSEHTWLGHDALTALGMRLIQFNSQSYVVCLALVTHLLVALLTYASLRPLTNRQDWAVGLAAAVGLAVCGTVKISTLHVAVGLYGWMLLSSGWWRKRAYQWSFGIAVGLCGLLTLHFAGNASGIAGLSLFKYHQFEVAPDWLWLQPLVLFWPLWAGAALAKHQRLAGVSDPRSLNRLLWSCGALMFLALAPTLVMQFYGACFYYVMLGSHFSVVMLWVVLSLHKEASGKLSTRTHSPAWVTWAGKAFLIWLGGMFLLTTWRKLDPVLKRQVEIRERFQSADYAGGAKNATGVIGSARELVEVMKLGATNLPRTYRVLLQLKQAGEDSNDRCRRECIYVPRENLPRLDFNRRSPRPNSILIPAYTRRCQIFGLSLMVDNAEFRKVNGFGSYKEGWDVFEDPPATTLEEVRRKACPKHVEKIVFMNSTGKLVRERVTTPAP
jgi:hypothetical protein